MGTEFPLMFPRLLGPAPRKWEHNPPWCFLYCCNLSSTLTVCSADAFCRSRMFRCRCRIGPWSTPSQSHWALNDIFMCYTIGNLCCSGPPIDSLGPFVSRNRVPTYLERAQIQCKDKRRTTERKDSKDPSRSPPCYPKCYPCMWENSQNISSTHCYRYI